ncbi:hypothetical protein [Chromobacterium haemolyticum]|uniref:hypothetical protein n=1 Tax=Chromobacterium haemolyticum TaxID=394935 RepID=UPI0013160E26|nr:hypothetical protein [Chromobacterium haemolyticum]BBH12952.1 hypothetical protein CH06BL_22000 [Chromobacterium haemolyticum]
MSSFDDFARLYGEVPFRRTLEIIAPANYDTFVSRLYEELGCIIQNLESAPKERSKDLEDRLSLEIVNCLKSAGYISEKDPTHGGHVDILVYPVQKKDMKWYAEAKIWGGVEYLNGGMDQLLTRYASGRHPSLGFIVYFKNGEIIDSMSKWAVCLKDRSDFQEKDESEDGFTFSTMHNHASGKNIMVRHFAVNLNWSPKIRKSKRIKL